MRKILANQDEMVAQWVASRIPIFEFGSSPYTAIGLMSDGVMLAGVVYQNYTRIDIQMHTAAVEGSRWLTSKFLGEVFRYPFEQLQVHRVTALIPALNTRSEKFCKHLGFKKEGRVREILPQGEDLLVYGMLKRECRFLNIGRFNGLANRFPEKSLSNTATAL
jgi:RimJ/RimL family protein N-acetyltransferase